MPSWVWFLMGLLCGLVLASSLAFILMVRTLVDLVPTIVRKTLKDFFAGKKEG